MTDVDPPQQQSATEIQEILEIRRMVNHLRRRDPVRNIAIALLNRDDPSGGDIKSLMTTLVGTPGVAAQSIRAALAGKSVRKIVTSLLRRDSDPGSDIEPLLTVLNDNPERRWKERAVAAWAIARMPLSADQSLKAIQALCKVLENRQIGGVRRVVHRSLRAAGWFIAATTAMVTTAGIILGSSGSMNLSNMIGASVLLLIFTGAFLTPLVSLSADAKRSKRVRAVAATSLGRLRSPQSVATLAGACYSSGVDRAAWIALHRTLPALSDDDYGRLDTQTVPNLCRLLEDAARTRPADYQPFIVKALDALGKIGDGRAVALVKRLAERARSEHTRSESIRAAAERILPILKERQRLEQDARRLLRPSSAPDTPAEVLLRPTGPTETPEALLLRPSDREA